VSGASILMEAGNAMQLPGRARAPEADWNKYAQQLTAQALVARNAAEKHDKQAVFDEGGKVYEVCVACHKQYVIDPMLAEQAKTGEPPHDPLPAVPGAKP
jgi:mono/diheme cytochrome c family protein